MLGKFCLFSQIIPQIISVASYDRQLVAEIFIATISPTTFIL